MAQRRKGKGTHKNGKAVGGQYTAGDRADDPPLSDPPTLARPLTRHDEALPAAGPDVVSEPF